MTGHNNSASFDHKHQSISTVLQVSHRKRKASPSLVLEKLFLQVESTLMLVYFNPSFQRIPFPLWHKFYGVQLHVLYVVLPTLLGSTPIVSAQQFIT